MTKESLSDRLQKAQPNICVVTKIASDIQETIKYFIKQNNQGIFLIHGDSSTETFSKLFQYLKQYKDYEVCEMNERQNKIIGYSKLNQGENN